MLELPALHTLRAADAPRTGAKAANLGELAAAGMPVPAGFCVPASVYTQVAGSVVASALAEAAQDGTGLAGSAEMLRRAIEGLDFPADLRAALADAYARACPDGGRVAVRSSGTSEDSAETSFAGQYHTELGVGPGNGDLATAVKRCWASLWTRSAVHYRERVGIPHTGAAMAVIVQVLVPADAAGVMFTSDTEPGPAACDGMAPTGTSIVIESSWGLGEAVVGGLVTPDRFTVPRDRPHSVHAVPARKERMIVEADDGTREEPVPEKLSAMPSLSAEYVQALAGLGLRIEEAFGQPQDIEWAVTGTHVWILQARPITRRAPQAAVSWDSPVPGTSWARISICDSWLPEPLSPLFATTLFPLMVEEWVKNWAGPRPESNPLIPRPMASTINGYAYLRFDYPLNRHPVRTVHLILSWFRFHLARVDKRWRDHVLPRHTRRIAELSELDLKELDDDALLAALSEAETLSAEYWGIIGGLTWYWNLGEYLMAGAYPFAVKHIASDAVPARAYGALLQGTATTTSAAEAKLYDLARSHADDTETRSPLGAFLAEHGHQVYNLDFAEPVPAEDLDSALATVKSYRVGDAADPRERLATLAARRDRLRARIRYELRRAPVRRAALNIALRWAVYAENLRDRALDAFTLGWPFMRRGHLELGRRLVAARILDSPDDVFYLTGDEVSALLTNGEPGSHAKRVRERRELRERQRLLTPPAQVPAEARIRLGGMDITSLALFGRTETHNPEAAVSGSAVSPGRVTATARIVLGPQGFARLGPGEVLVAPYITPAWSPLLGIAAAVVTDTGGALSHGSIVAREYGIPAVMGTGDATKKLRDGQTVTVDGDAGAVY